MIKRVLILITLVSIQPLSEAADLLDVYHQALENDPAFKAAYSTYLSNTQSIPIARSALLPQLTATSQFSDNSLDAVTSGFETQQGFNSRTFQLSASQAIFNYQAWAQVQQAKAAVKAAHASFNDAAQNLILRVAQAYFDVLLSKDTLNFATAKKRANKRQLKQAQDRFDVGLDTITSVYEAKAAYDQSIAEVISAQNRQINKNENLRKITNNVYETISPLRNSTIPLIKPEPNNVEDWIATGLKQNYKLFAANYSLQAARENIKVQATGNWPVIALAAATSSTVNSVSASNFFIPQTLKSSNVGIGMKFPAYQGGLTTAQTQQARYDFQTSSEQLEQTYRGVMVDSRVAFNTIIDGISKVKADRQTVISRTNSLNAVDAQFQVGTRTMVDVVNAQEKLFQDQEELASDQYGFMMSLLKLKYLAGTLNVADLEELNSWLNTTRINGLPPKCLSAKHCKHSTSHQLSKN
jgi:outer membrane protein